MPRKSKEFLRRSAAARKGWRTRRRHERERSERSRRGWETRRANELKERRRIRKAKKEWAMRKRLTEEEYVDVIGIDSFGDTHA